MQADTLGVSAVLLVGFPGHCYRPQKFIPDIPSYLLIYLGAERQVNVTMYVLLCEDISRADSFNQLSPTAGL